ncbi:glycosyltransferase [Ligilactobacillus sp. WILCCON 0076]|uniref:Glycosyltransferase n=1 Tax=Ligilactobacillus ubinensis TaxID=2876789 RepID=A0A9X2JMS1_9LACO|nr:glycosyltransferase [Ligilactobacillus ubinensis]MCP0888044.1 glycosyltransferase [Ligilactobacillus ubinensis]
MIFVTVGTHEQQFNRLIREIDILREKRIIDEEVIVQSGYSTYKMKFCKQFDFLSYEEMKHYMALARIVITHGGPASFLMSLQLGKVPIVVPRQKKYGEHVNNHQFEFIQQLENRSFNIIPIYDVLNLKKSITEYKKTESSNSFQNNKSFNRKLKNIINQLMDIKE